MARARTNPAPPVTTAVLLGVPITGVLGTYVDDQDADTPQWPSLPQAQLTGGTVSSGSDAERWAIFKFPKVLTSFRSVSFGVGVFSLRVFGFQALVSVNYEVELISVDFDIEQVTWNNKPASTPLAGNPVLNMDADLSDETSASVGNGAGIFGMRPGADVAGPFTGFYWKPTSVSFGVNADGVRGSVSAIQTGNLVVLQTLA